MSKGIVLVPTDFSKVGDCALNHGAKLASSSGRGLVVLHVVGNQQDVSGAKGKVESIATKLGADYGVDCKGIVRVGNIFDDIGDTAAELGARLIIMGTHGMKGMQKFMGSHALKVITNSEVPFIVVQEKGIGENGYSNIVLPIDLEKETKQKLRYAVDIASHYDSTIHLLFQKAGDADLDKILKGNIIFAKKYLAENNVSFSTNILDGEGDFNDEVVAFAEGKDADLIAIMNTPDGIFDTLLGGSTSDEQEMITNKAQIPVLIVNPTTVSGGGGLGYFS